MVFLSITKLLIGTVLAKKKVMELTEIVKLIVKKGKEKTEESVDIIEIA